MAGIGDLVANLAVNKSAWTSGLSGAKKDFSSFTGGISAGLGSIAGLFAGAFGAKVSVDAFSESLTQSRKLESVLQATGGAADLSSQQIADYAGELQSLTNFEDDATVGAAAVLAGFTNIKGDVFKTAIASAQDMSAVLGTDLQSNVQLLGKALNDPTEGLAKLSRAGIQFTEEQTAQITALQASGDMLGAQGVILDAVAGKFGGAAQATADPMKQLSNTIGDVAEMFGSVLLPAVTVGATAISDLLGVVMGGSDTFASFGIEAAVQLSSIGQYLVLGATQWELMFVQIGASASHFFTESLPRYFDWFTNNWQNIFVTAAANTLTIFENLGSNIASAMEKIWDFIASGGTGQLELAWEPLTRGFINTIDALPDIPDRVVSEFEKSIAQSIEDQGNTIAESQAAMRKKLEEQFNPLKAAKVAGAAAEEFDEFGKKEKEKTAATADNTAALVGSSQAARLILGGVNGSGAGNKQEQLAAKANGFLQQIASKMTDGLKVEVEEVTC